MFSFRFVGVQFSASGDVTTNGITTLVPTQPGDSEEEEKEVIIINVDEPVTSTFSCKQLILFTKATPLSAHVQLLLSSDGAPLQLKYEIKGYGHIHYYLAAKVDNNDD